MKVLVACEFSGRVRDAFIRRGHDAWSCDLLPSESDAGPHIQGNVVPLLSEEWDLVIAHPPCTRLCNSGVRWLHERNLWKELDESAAFFVKFLNANAPKVAVENPTPHRYARERIGRGPDFAIQPYHFGHDDTKRTCFWVRNLPPLMSSILSPERSAVVHRESPSPDRWKNRSRTYTGIAEAMADQWGSEE